MNSDYIELLDATEVFALPDPRWLIDQWLPEGGYSSIYGKPGTYKSFLAIDWALHISQGMPWMGHAVERGPVIYVAAEGGRGIKKRMRAWVDHHQANPELWGAYFLISPIYVQEEGVVESFIELLEREDIFPAAIFIDTASRCFIGEENASEDMAKFVDRMTALARGRSMTGVVIHHTNAGGERERGHSAFRGGAEAMFQTDIKKDKKSGQLSYIKLTCTKQKDDEEPEPIYLKPFPVGKSIILQAMEAPTSEPKSSGADIPMRKRDMLAVLASHPEGLTWREWLIASQMDQISFKNRFKKLKKDSEIMKVGDRWFVVPSAVDIAQIEEEE